MSRDFSNARSMKGSGGADINIVFGIDAKEGQRTINQGESVEGYFVDLREDVGDNKSNIYSLKDDDGNVSTFWGTFVLDDQLSKVAIGTYVKIQYDGKVKSKKGGRAYHSYEVFVLEGEVHPDFKADAEPAIETTTPQTANAAPASAGGSDDDLPF